MQLTGVQARRAPRAVAVAVLLCVIAHPRPIAAQLVPTARPPALATPDTRLAESRLAASRLDQALAPDARAAVAAQLAAAARAGVPAEPLVAKALEGVELGAPPPRIVTAVGALYDRLVAARTALTPVVSDAELVSGADALAAGVPAVALRRVRASSPNRSAAVALGVLAQLVARGVPATRATDAVTALLRRGARPQQLVALDSAVRTDVASGVPAAAALEARARTLTGGLLLAPGGAPGVTTTDAATQSAGPPRHHP